MSHDLLTPAPTDTVHRPNFSHLPPTERSRAESDDAINPNPELWAMAYLNQIDLSEPSPYSLDRAIAFNPQLLAETTAWFANAFAAGRGAGALGRSPSRIN